MTTLLRVKRGPAILLVSAILILVAAMAFGAVALAKPGKTYSTSSSLQVKAKTLEGKISSPKAACRKGRRVQGAWRGPGVHAVTEAVTSNSAGRWSIDFEVSPGSKGSLSIVVSAESLAGGAVCKKFEKSEIVGK